MYLFIYLKGRMIEIFQLLVTLQMRTIATGMGQTKTRSQQRHLVSYTDVGSAQVLAAGKSAGTEIDFKYAIIGTAVGVAISAAFLALKICVIRKQLLESDSSDARSAPAGSSDPAAWKKRRSARNAQVIEL